MIIVILIKLIKKNINKNKKLNVLEEKKEFLMKMILNLNQHLLEKIIEF
jgi:hypothetical protein